MAARRLDVELVERGLAPSREQARGLILAGDVRVGDVVVTKAGAPVADDAAIAVAERQRYVSRGGHKLAGALDTFGVNPVGVAAIDIGASTGGFTDCLLQHGATAVTAVDVGYGQLAWQLRSDDRVRVLERTNIRSADPVLLGDGYALAVIDVSFIGLAKVLPAVRPLLAPGGGCLALVKPQFEAGKGRIGKKGVVRDPAVHCDVLATVLDAATREGWAVRGLTWSPITGPEGNIEFWAWLGVDGESVAVDVPGIVEAAHAALGG
ncbi:MAG: TlyA family RNA methyltransferase [Coriobacteriia bacterium]|nr:TlyA family RNA methyltransferase [Coriobacteriia bacterium]MBN2840627.1 TlyA family RNA methyltransferase [Coriobacteriia bacterium]